MWYCKWTGSGKPALCYCCFHAKFTAQDSLIQRGKACIHDLPRGLGTRYIPLCTNLDSPV